MQEIRYDKNNKIVLLSINIIHPLKGSLQDDKMEVLRQRIKFG